MIERNGLIQHGGQDVTVVGPDMVVGEKAPEFVVHTQSFTDFEGLAETRGKVRILAAVPSLESSVCDRETRTFNQEAANLSDDIAILVISADLPPAQKRWCGAAGVEQVLVLSDHKAMDFGAKYGCLLKEPRVLRRAVFVVDRDDQLVYVAYMPVLGEEPNYEEVLAAAKAALG